MKKTSKFLCIEAQANDAENAKSQFNSKTKHKTKNEEDKAKKKNTIKSRYQLQKQS